MAANLSLVLAFVITAAASGTPEATAAGTSVRAQIERSLELAERDAALPTPLVNLSYLADDVWHRHFDCFASYQAIRVPICPLGATSARRTVVALGDSHIGQWLATLDILGKRRGFKVIPLIKMSCAPYDVRMAIEEVDGEYTECTEFRRWARRTIARLQPAAVVLASRVLAAGSDQTTMEVRAADWKRGVESGVRRLLRNGAQREGAVRPPGGGTGPGRVPATACRDDGDLRVLAGEARHAREPGRPRSRARGWRDVRNVTPLVCLHELCPAIVGRVVTFRDDDHITITWAKAVARESGGRLGLS